MTPLTCYNGQSVAVFGLGGSGLVTCEALKAGGCTVIAWDDNEASREKARAAGFDVVDLRERGLDGLNALILAPGVPLTHPEPHWTAKMARGMLMPIFGDVELFDQERRATVPSSPFIAITGTNGKSTTTALTAHIIRASGRDTQMGGNIGTAILSLEPPAMNRFHVIECSSFQLDLAHNIRPSVGVLLNITPDHIDRHGSLENYASVKSYIFQNMAPQDARIIGVDDAFGRRMADWHKEQGHLVEEISVQGPVETGLWFDGATIYRVKNDREVLRFTLNGIGSLRGAHNAQNAMAAYAACDAAGLSEGEILAGMATFPGLAHRMEQIGRVGKVLFVNDSKATNADSAEKALSSFGSIYWIAGGKPKEGGIAPLERFFPAIRKSYLIGAASDEFAEALGAHPHVKAGTLDNAVALAAEDAAKEGLDDAVVLLSPACASYDQFPNFEVRGEAFRKAVMGLPGFTPIS